MGLLNWNANLEEQIPLFLKEKSLNCLLSLWNKQKQSFIKIHCEVFV